MTVVDFRNEGRRSAVFVRGWSGSRGRALCVGARSRARHSGPARTAMYALWLGGESGQRECVHNVHTLGFGSGRTGAGLGRIAEVLGGVADIQGLEPGSSPTSGTCFPCSGA